VVYSDLGYITLGAVVTQIGGASLDYLAQREVFRPLGMTHTHYRPIASHAISRDQGAATASAAPTAARREASPLTPGEDQPARYLPRRPERSEGLAALSSGGSDEALVSTEVVPARGGVLRGEVHDENAAAMGGVSGHAGLFSTCADLERFCRLWLGEGVLDGERYLSPATVRAATRDQTGPVRGEPSRRGLGWVLQPNPLWVPSDLYSVAAYSHTGFTGTSLLIDPVAGIFAVLLTNRVHPTREGGSAERIRTVRARFHNAVWAALA
jgi:CubicO group peptidase (beta-lactamase class C family)